MKVFVIFAVLQSNFKISYTLLQKSPLETGSAFFQKYTKDEVIVRC